MNSWYDDYVLRLIDCQDCKRDIQQLFPVLTDAYPDGLCYLPSEEIKLMFVAEAPGLGNEVGPVTNREVAVRDFKLHEWLNYLQGNGQDFKKDSYGRFVFKVVNALENGGCPLDWGKIAVTNCIKFPIPKRCDINTKMKIALNHQMTHLAEEFQYSKPKVVIALGSTAINTIQHMSKNKFITYERLIKLPHPSGSSPSGWWHYESYNLFEMFIQYLTHNAL